MTFPRALALPTFAALLAVGLVAASGQDPESPIKTHAVRGQISYLEGSGGNIGVMVGPDGALLIDDQFAPVAEAILKAVKELGGDAPVWLVNTHWHGDHTGGNEFFGQTATIVSHDNVRRRLNGDEAIGGRVARGAPAAGSLPTITYDGELSLHVNGEDVRLIHVGPGHTDGDSIVWFEGSNVVHMGDLFFNIGYPFIDLDSGGDIEGLIDACHHVLDLVPDDVAVIPGHGEATDVDGLRAYVAMVEECLARFRKAHTEGKSATEALDAGLLDDFNERWGSFSFVPPEKWAATLMNYLGR